MCSQILLCLFVGYAFASNNPGWQENNEYVYQVNGRTLIGLNEVSNEYSGVLLKATLSIRPRADGKLYARIFNAKYGQVHSSLSDGWLTDIADSEVSYKNLEFAEKPFIIEMKNGIVRNIYVSKGASNWEANIIRAVVGQFQLDTKAENIIESPLNTLPEQDEYSGVYKTMEDSVTGIYETLYDIHLLPEHHMLAEPELVPLPNLKGDGHMIEIVKSRNYSHSEERPSYHYGLSPDGFFEASSKVEDFFTRTSMSRAVVTGSLSRYTIQSSFSFDEILISPTLENKQKGSVVSILNITLESVQRQNEQNDDVPNPVALGSLVYRFDDPFAQSNEARPGKPFTRSTEYDADTFVDNEQPAKLNRQTRSANLYDSFDDDQLQETPQISEAPKSPLLPLTVGYKGLSYKKDHNIVQEVQKLAQKIGQDLQNPDNIPQQNTASNFLALTSLLRTMDKNEIEEASKALYSTESGHKRDSWAVFRDAVAQAGTGPALLIIMDWIAIKQITTEEAADVVATAAYSARQPTEEYMRLFYTGVTDPENIAQRTLNETGLLAYSQLLHDVYVNKKTTHNRYPVHSFGQFDSSNGENFLKSEVIPYLTEQLHQAVGQADVRKIHLYIRVLGNVGHHNILAAFEPYLEGHKQASQFQRLLMVLALDKLTQANPQVARSVLYKIYQNPGEGQELRVAAVFQLIRTSPPADMLQRMASYTHIDRSEQVNAAVKNTIQYAAQLEGDEFSNLREAAQSAQHLLVNKEYGMQSSRNMLHNYVVKELELSYKQSVQLFGAFDSFIPKGLKYSLRKNIGGVRQRLLNAEMMVSSIDELTNVLKQQTESYSQQKYQKQSGNEQNQWSSENIAKLLDATYETEEQLEGNVHVQYGSMHKYFSFDNNSIEMWRYELSQLEEEFQNGKNMEYMKIRIANEIAISFPTEMGLPFIYTYDEPVILRFSGRVQAKTSPSMFAGNRITLPDTVDLDLEMNALVSQKVHSQLSFITPFDNQRYSAGYEKNLQMRFPVEAKVQIDTNKMQLSAEIEPKREKITMLHISSWPYTSKTDVFSQQPAKKIIKSARPHVVDTTFGQKATGIALRLQATTDEDIMNVASLLGTVLKSEDPVGRLLSAGEYETIQHTDINISVDVDKSSVKKISLHLGFSQMYQAQAQAEADDESNQFDNVPVDSYQRQMELMKRAAAGIYNAEAYAMDGSIEFYGQQNIKYTATGAIARSNVDSKSRYMMLMKKNGGERNDKTYKFSFLSLNELNNTEELNLEKALEASPTASSHIKVAFGEKGEPATNVDAYISLHKSDSRKEYLKRQPGYIKCKHQMSQGNQQLDACAQMTVQANLLDRFNVKMQYNNADAKFVKGASHVYSALRYIGFPEVYDNVEHGTGADELQVSGGYSDDLELVNVTIKMKNYATDIENIKMNDWAREILAVHPMLHVKSRFIGKIFYSYDNYYPYCVMDKTAAQTFNNRTYNAIFSDKWSVILQHIPKRAQHYRQQSVKDQLKHQVENYVVLGRASPQWPSQKEVKITFDTSRTQGKVVEVTCSPSGPKQAPKVNVNGEEIKYNEKQSRDYANGALQVYAVGGGGGELKVVVRDAFYMIYDGVRVKLVITDGKFRDSVRGLCGTFNGQPTSDFLSPQDCILRDPQQFMASYTVLAGDNAHIQQLQRLAGKGECYRDDQVQYANVISGRDAGKEAAYSRRPGSGQCTKHQTRYVSENGQICFTLRPVPVCMSSCQQHGAVFKSVAVHCVQKSNVSELWKKQIDKGASPDFSSKSQSKTIRMEIPQRCY